MKQRLPVLAILALTLGLTVAACGGGSDGREVEIVAGEEACSPATFTAAPGEALALVVRNDASTDREIEGINGTQLEEVLIPSGRTRTMDFTFPADGAVQTFKCYRPGGPETIIELTSNAS